jgi:mono/diheme cytochrome c family protein
MGTAYYRIYNMKKKYLVTLVVAGAALFAACNSGDTRRNPGKTYVPDMVYSRAYDAYTKNPVTRDSLTSQLPVEGTVARGHALPDHLTEGDTLAYNALQSPFTFSDAEMAEGKRMFNIYCGICHGTDLDGNGPLFASGKFASMPANLKSGAAYLAMPVGKMYHAIMYGKNMMGSYASQLDVHQRWEVLAYIKKVQSENGGAPFTMGVAGTPKAGAADAKPVADTTVAKK